MSGYNRVILMGNLTREPETRFTQSGMAIVKVGLAVNERVKDGDNWKDRATFVDVTLFGKRGEAFAKFHTKGNPAFIEGRLRLDQWDDKNTGQKRQKLYVVADHWGFCGGKNDRQAQPAASSSGGGDSFGMDDDSTPF